MSQTTHQPSGPFYIGIEFYKHNSVFCVVDDRNTILERGRIDHKIPIGFELLIKRYPGCRAAFETTMNWHWLYEILEAHIEHKDIVLANAYKMRIIAEAQVKTDKVDAYMLAKFLKAELISTVHIPSKSTWQLKEVLRQRCFSSVNARWSAIAFSACSRRNTICNSPSAATCLVKRGSALWANSLCPIRRVCC
jgi:hypothetical protein